MTPDGPPGPASPDPETLVDPRPALGRAARALADRIGVAARDREALAALLPLLQDAAPLGPTDGGGADRSDAVADTFVEGPADDPGGLGRLHESLLEDAHRHRHGVHYTPPAVAAFLVERALGPGLDDLTPDGPLVADPSCGGGVFLLATADRLAGLGLAPDATLGCLHGVDLDPLAVEVTRTALILWAARAGLSGSALRSAATGVLERVVVGDALDGIWPGEGRLDAVVGNPPFGGQLGRTTARGARSAEVARQILGGAAAGYADTAGLFLVRAVAAAAPGGCVAMLQPLSFLGSRDSGAVRRRLEEAAVLTDVWLADGRIFGAAVDVCAPVLRVAGPMAVPDPAGAGPVRVRGGDEGSAPLAVERDRLTRAGSWAPVAAARAGVPAVDLGGREVLGSWARATAGFRDEFYALAPFVVDLLAADSEAQPGGVEPPLGPGQARLVTAGLIEPGRTLWAQRATRLAGRRLGAPAVDTDALRAWATGPDGDRRLDAWADARLRPKVVVATQTRVVEAAVDDDGSWWPSVPVISVVLDPHRDDEADRWLVAAALSAPPVCAWAAERSAGTALAAHALKLSARQVVAVPLPVDRDAWSQGAELLRSVATAVDDIERSTRLLAAGRALTEAHSLPAPMAGLVLDWWARRAGCAVGG